MQESQRVQGGQEQFLHFGGGQGPVGQHLRKGLFGMLHHDEEKLAAFQLAQPRVEKPNQVRMGQLDRHPPVRQQCQGDPLGRDHLDRRVGDALRLAFGKEYRAVV